MNRRDDSDEIILIKIVIESINKLTEMIETILRKETKMALDITALRDAVAQERTVVDSVKLFIQKLLQQIQDLINASGSTVDPVELQNLVDQIKSANADLAAAVVENTPAV